MPRSIRTTRGETGTEPAARDGTRGSDGAFEEAPYRSLFESAGEGLFICDPEGRYLEANPALARLLGHETPAALLAASRDGDAPRYVDPQRRRALLAVLAAEGAASGFESEIERRDGSRVWISESARAIRDASGVCRRIEGSATDVTARRLAEAALRESEQRYALAAQAAAEGLWDWNFVTGRVGYSPRWKALLGLADSDVGDSLDDWLGRVHPDDQVPLRGALDTHLARRTACFESEFRMRHRDGSWRWMRARGLAAFDEGGTPLRIAGSQTDVTRQKLDEGRQSHDAFHDPLTGLPNRALFTDRLSRAILRARRHEDYAFAVVFIGLDRLTLINDSLGRSVGDRLLVAIARRIENSLRAGDSAARVGGDEFAVLIDELGDPSDAIRVVNRVAEAIREPVTLAGEELYSSASTGIAYHKPSYERAGDMLRDADTAMHAAKSAGGGRSLIFDVALHERAVNRLRIEGALRRALDRSEFCAHYQPVVDLGSGKLAGFEALIRWQHPERGLIPPLVFIPIAEETGLIHPLGRWVLREACRQLAEWNTLCTPEDRLSISVNLSGRQLTEPDLVSGVVEVLEETEIDPAQLKLEITESAVMADAEIAAERLAQLRSLGIGLSIDDFGTGYSSLSYLHRLPLTALKIDKTFVWSMASSLRETQICQGIVSLAHNLGLTVVAEGIETPEQRRCLAELRCEYGQGYLFAKPLPAEEATELVRSGKGW